MIDLNISTVLFYVMFSEVWFRVSVHWTDENGVEHRTDISDPFNRGLSHIPLNQPLYEDLGEYLAVQPLSMELSQHIQATVHAETIKAYDLLKAMIKHQ